MTELEGVTKSAQCVDSSRIATSKVEAARHRKVGVDCYFMPSVSTAASGR